MAKSIKNPHKMKCTKCKYKSHDKNLEVCPECGEQMEKVPEPDKKSLSECLRLNRGLDFIAGVRAELISG